MIPEATTYTTDRGIRVLRTVEDVPVEGAIDGIVDALDSRRGALFASSFEYPGRYTRWDVGFVDPLLEVACRGREVSVTALNRRGPAGEHGKRLALLVRRGARGAAARVLHAGGARR